MSTPARPAEVAALNDAITTKPRNVCTMCGESVGLFWAAKICRRCFIESEGYTSEQEYNAYEGRR